MSAASRPPLSVAATAPVGHRQRDARSLGERFYRRGVIAVLAAIALSPVLLIIYQSMLDGPFFEQGVKLNFSAFRFVLEDPDFFIALKTTVIFTIGMVAIAVPMGAALAFLTTRTDLRFRGPLELLVLMPMFLSSLILAFGYVVSIGPQGFLTIAWRSVFGPEPWNIYSLTGMTMVAGLAHVPHVYLYVAAAMRNLPSDLEEAARCAGASVWRVWLDVTLPLIAPALVFATMLNVLLGFEVFGIPIVLGESSGISVLTTYIYKLSTILGTPSYEAMAVVAVFLIALTLPLVWLQRRLLRRSQRFSVVGGKGARSSRMRLSHKGQAVALSCIGIWLLGSVALPLSGIVIRAFVSAWGAGVDLWHHVSLDSFRMVMNDPALVRGIVNTSLLAVVGGAIAVVAYLLVSLAAHRSSGREGMVLDYLTLLPRALPGLVVGLAFLWVFLFLPFLAPFRGTLFGMLLAYMVVGLSYGLRVIQSTLMQVAPELEEAARISGATFSRSWRDVVVPIIRPGIVGAWVLIMVLFIKENATGIYLMGSGTEVIGSLIVILTQSGNINPGAVLALVNIVMIVTALLVALRLGARIRD